MAKEITMGPHHSAAGVTLLHGDVCDPATYASVASSSVRAIITSPPYFGLRDYGVEGQIGNEASPAEYVANLVNLFRDLRRVLADDGTLWLNLGDSYYSGRGNPGPNADDKKSQARRGWVRPVDRPGQTWAKPKNLLGIPWRVAFALQDDGWVLRSEVIWSKPNPLPESVTDRPTKAHEHLFMLTKRPRYYFDAAAVREPDVGSDHKRSVLSGQASLEPSGGIMPEHSGLRKAAGRAGEGRNIRDVWTVPTVPFGDAHFAVYPPELIRPCVRASTEVGDTVLDPFSGSGTTGMVARQEGRRYIGIELNREYLDLSLRTRFAQPVMDLWGGDAA